MKQIGQRKAALSCFILESRYVTTAINKLQIQELPMLEIIIVSERMEIFLICCTCSSFGVTIFKLSAILVTQRTKQIETR